MSIIAHCSRFVASRSRMVSAMSGWIKAYRDWRQNPVIWKDADYIAVWLYLNFEATHEERQKFFGGHLIPLRPGQLITGRRVISDSIHVEESKVKRILLAFESAHLIDRQRSNKSSLISVLSWDLEQNVDQQIDQQLTSQRPANDHITRKREGKNERSSFIPPSLEEVENYFREKGYSSDSHAFYEYYLAGEWTKSDGAPLKNWQRAAAGWESNFKTWGIKRSGKGSGSSANGTNPNQRRDYGGDFG